MVAGLHLGYLSTILPLEPKGFVNRVINKHPMWHIHEEQKHFLPNKERIVSTKLGFLYLTCESQVSMEINKGALYYKPKH